MGFVERVLDSCLLIVAAAELKVLDDSKQKMCTIAGHRVVLFLYVREVNVQMVIRRLVVEVCSYAVLLHSVLRIDHRNLQEGFNEV